MTFNSKLLNSSFLEWIFYEVKGVNLAKMVNRTFKELCKNIFYQYLFFSQKYFSFIF